VLIKAVIQAIPTYSMGVFQLPKSLCQRLNSVIERSWWWQHLHQRKIVWVKWDNLGTSKHLGGMGFRDLEVFNLAFLAKQGWRLVQHPDSLVARVLQDKYFRGDFFLAPLLGRRPSFAWRSILNARPLLQKGIFLESW
jgi:hypothetical protein